MRSRRKRHDLLLHKFFVEDQCMWKNKPYDVIVNVFSLGSSWGDSSSSGRTQWLVLKNLTPQVLALTQIQHFLHGLCACIEKRHYYSTLQKKKTKYMNAFGCLYISHQHVPTVFQMRSPLRVSLTGLPCCPLACRSPSPYRLTAPH